MTVQVVTLAVYAYFVACLFGRQYLLPTQYRTEGARCGNTNNMLNKSTY